jgi:hypothetical protein
MEGINSLHWCFFLDNNNLSIFMNNLYAVLAAAILSACAATPYVSDSNSELLKASALQFPPVSG